MDNQLYPPNDHDLLIVVSTKLTQLSLDIKSLNDNLSAKVTAIEAKTVLYDQYFAEFPLKDINTQLQKNSKWINDFRLTWKIVLALVLGTGSFVTWALVNLINFFKLNGR